MKSFPQSNNLFNESIRLLATCPVCHKQYAQTNAKIVDEVEDAHLLHVRCGKCSSSVVAIIFTTGFGMTSMGILTDLNSGDLSKFKEWKNISQNEVLDLYQYLQKERLLAI